MSGLSRTKELVIRGGSRFPPHLMPPGLFPRRMRPRLPCRELPPAICEPLKSAWPLPTSLKDALLD